MKKVILCLITIIVVLLISILFPIVLTNIKYSKENVKNLILKGVENMENLKHNGSFEMEISSMPNRYYYKENKIKQLILGKNDDLSCIIEDLDQGKTYVVFDKGKRIYNYKHKKSMIDTKIRRELARVCG